MANKLLLLQVIVIIAVCSIIHPSSFVFAFQSSKRDTTTYRIPDAGHHNTHGPNLSNRRRMKSVTMTSLRYDDFSELINGDGDDDATTVSLNLNGQSSKVNGCQDWSISSSASISSFPRLQSILLSSPISYPPQICTKLLQLLSDAGFIDDNDVIQFTMGFIHRQEIISQVLLNDFQWGVPLDAHRARVGMVALVHDESKEDEKVTHNGDTANVVDNSRALPVRNIIQQTVPIVPTATKLGHSSSMPEPNNEEKGGDSKDVTTQTIKFPSWKSVIVDDKARIRRGGSGSGSGSSKAKSSNATDNSSTASATKKDSYNYGLLQPTNTNDSKDEQTYTNLYTELESFLSYMTIPQTSTVSDPPIREQTASVYMRHARLFLGWIVDARSVLLEENDLFDEVLLNGEGDVVEDDEDRTIVIHSSPLASSKRSSLSRNKAKNVRLDSWKHVHQRLSSTSSGTSTIDKDEIQRSISLFDIFQSHEAESASPILQYVLWLRSERGISPNYEANILRGMIKLVKYRFAHEMSSSAVSSHSNNRNGSSGVGSSTRTTSLDDLPIVIELRKLHREAGNKGKKAPRSSDEGKKWMEWSEYLEVIQLLKADLNDMIDEYDMRVQQKDNEQDADADRAEGNAKKTKAKPNTKSMQTLRKEIANVFQRYLVLSFLACVPDRQRTFRELELGRSFLRVDEDGGNSMWVIKHTADDYKTGSTYGERPPLPLTITLTSDIDDFLDRWRPALLNPDKGESSFLFLQPRTGNPLTANSVYQIVSRCCYRYKQKKTNPHLLRDMIVTHVRKSADASEKELEALALFMGHSIQMQRDSYDRRTLEQKVRPAVKLMNKVNER